MELSLRQLGFDELAALAWGDHPAGLPPPFSASALPPAWVLARAVARIVEGQPRAWWLPLLAVRSVDGAIVGGCGFKGPPLAGRVEIFYGVARECRGAGIASVALQQLIALGAARGAGELLAEIESANLASVRTALRCGFTMIGRRVAEGGVEVGQWLRTTGATPLSGRAQAPSGSS